MFCGPKIHKRNAPLSPIVSSRDSVIYGEAKKLAGIVQVNTPYPKHANFIESIKDIELQPGECIAPYDITASFTLVPVDKALNTTHKLVQDQ